MPLGCLFSFSSTTCLALKFCFFIFAAEGENTSRLLDKASVQTSRTSPGMALIAAGADIATPFWYSEYLAMYFYETVRSLPRLSLKIHHFLKGVSDLEPKCLRGGFPNLGWCSCLRCLKGSLSHHRSKNASAEKILKPFLGTKNLLIFALALYLCELWK